MANHDPGNAPTTLAPEDQVLLRGLARLVYDKSVGAFRFGRPVSGLSRQPTGEVGLSAQERRVMAGVSKIMLRAGQADRGAEIHDLLFLCTQPLQRWLPMPGLDTTGYADIELLDAESGLVTPDAEEMARNYSSAAAVMEDILFSDFRDALSQQPAFRQAELYTACREFVVRHPVVSNAGFREFVTEFRVPKPIWAILSTFYEPVPPSATKNGRLLTCSACSNTAKPAGAADEILCRSRNCRYARIGHAVWREAQDLLQLTSAFQQFWADPGVPEVYIFDQLKAAGLAPELYPHLDRVDIALGEVGIDLKVYQSPENLAYRLSADIGGLADYGRKMLVVPDWLATRTERYVARLEGRLEGHAQTLKCLTVSEALQALGAA